MKASSVFTLKRHVAPDDGKNSFDGWYGELPLRSEEPRHVGQGEPVMYAAE